jgi:hypothetical protein
VPGALHRDEGSPGHLRQLLADDERPDRVVGAVDDEHRAGDAAADLPEGFAVVQLPALVSQGQGRPIGVQAPSDAVLDLLGRVRLGEHLAEEELEEVAVVLEPVVAVVLVPPVVGLHRLVERGGRADGVLRERRGGRDEGCPLDALGMLGREERAPEGAGREPHEDGAVGLGGVHDGQRVGGELALRVCLDRGGAVRAAVAAPVERDHAGVAREIRDLRLPVARVDDRPRGQQQDRRLT